MARMASVLSFSRRRRSFMVGESRPNMPWAEAVAIRDGRPPRLSLEESVRNMRVIDHIRDTMKV